MSKILEDYHYLLIDSRTNFGYDYFVPKPLAKDGCGSQLLARVKEARSGENPPPPTL